MIENPNLNPHTSILPSSRLKTLWPFFGRSDYQITLLLAQTAGETSTSLLTAPVAESANLTPVNKSGRHFKTSSETLRDRALDTFLCGNVSSTYFGRALVRFGSYQSQSSVALSTNRNLRSVTVADIT